MSSGGFSSTGARGNRSAGLKYPVPGDSGLQERGVNRFIWFEVSISGTGGFRCIYKYTGASGNRFTWFEVSGTGGFRSTDLEARGNRFTSNNPAPEDWKYVSSLFYNQSICRVK